MQTKYSAPFLYVYANNSIANSNVQLAIRHREKKKDSPKMKRHVFGKFWAFCGGYRKLLTCSLCNNLNMLVHLSQYHTYRSITLFCHFQKTSMCRRCPPSSSAYRWFPLIFFLSVSVCASVLPNTFLSMPHSYICFWSDIIIVLKQVCVSAVQVIFGYSISVHFQM